MARAVWVGLLSIGQVQVPVKLFTAVRKRDVTFRLLDARTGALVRQRRVSAADGSDVPAEAVVRGVEVAPGQFVTLTPTELAAVAPARTRSLSVEYTTAADAVDPVYVHQTYYVVPVGPEAEHGYAVLAGAFEATNAVGIGRLVLRGTEHPVALHVKHDVFMATTLWWADEVVPAVSCAPLAARDRTPVAARDQQLATALVAALHTPFTPEAFADTYRARLLAFIEHKAAGGVITLAPPPPLVATEDLTAALEASLAGVPTPTPASQPDKNRPPATVNATSPGKAPDGDKVPDGGKVSAAAKAKARRKATAPKATSQPATPRSARVATTTAKTATKKTTRAAATATAKKALTKKTGTKKTATKKTATKKTATSAAPKAAARATSPKPRSTPTAKLANASKAAQPGRPASPHQTARTPNTAKVPKAAKAAKRRR